MMSRSVKRNAIGPLLAVALIGILAAFAAGCGGDDGDEGGTEEATTEEFTDADVTATIEIEMKEFAFIPKDASGPAGIDEIVTPNIGQVEHELELFKSDVDPGSLTVEPEEDKADTSPLGEEILETFAEPGQTDSAIADLKPGKYAMICNVAGHYAAGMWGNLTIK